ncbi:T9SS type A sorting domain-containing protein [Hymenobacter aerilatus]|uniref:T9SS type A sorting domain-containing protein n=1 Tax=Hymenobacter aerilatus TaxID=2932251 RepID=A0A8T9SPH0_9BACT|nr:T9SS type A sorting domain-containing protein [Hymenobacter aerilatus]UOR03597.1 T9SS type A sorting domain-containing protein [Hymenobacter aerilatus]
MKKLYSLPWSKVSFHRLLALLLICILVPSIANAQARTVFKETMGLVLAGDDIPTAETENYFDEGLLTYSGTAIGGDESIIPVTNPLAGASNGGNITFGAFVDGAVVSTSTERTFVISDIIGPISGGQLTFSLYIPSGRAGTQSVSTLRNNFVVETSVNGTSFTAATYEPVNGSTNVSVRGWNALRITSAIPVVNSLTIRFRKVSGATVLYSIDDIELVGSQTGISISTSNIDFNNTYVNERSAASRLTVSGAGLTSNIVLTAPDGFLLRKGTEDYSLTTTLTQSNGNVASTAIDVIFAPTVAKTYSGTLTVSSSGSETRNVSLSGTSEVRPPSTLVAPPSITFGGSTVVGQASTPSNFTVSGNNLTADVIVTPPNTNYQIRLGNTGSFTNNAITLTPVDGTLAQTTLQVRFLPTTSGTITGGIRVASTGAGDKVVELTATATAAPTGPTVNAAPTDLAFGTASGSGSSTTLTFDVSGTNLTENLIITPSNSNIVIRDQLAGGSFVNTPLSFAPVNGTVSNRTIEVRLVGPVASGAFNGTISVGSGNALPKTVNVTASPVLEGNSTINTEGTLAVFEAVPGQPSLVQSYIITGTNLLQDVTIQAPNFFQISTTNNFSALTTTGNTIVVARNSGNDLSATRIYVRYFPTAAQTNTNTILHTSNPALGVSLSVTGTSEPSLILEQAYANRELVIIGTNGTAQGLTLTGKRVNQTVTISFLQQENRSNPDNTPQFQLSLDNTTFSNTLVVNPDPQTSSISRTIYVRYSPTYLGGQNGASATLRFQSNDFSTSSPQAFAANFAVVGSSIDTRPTRDVIATVTRNGTSATVNFNLPGNYAAQGYGEGRLIIASEQAALNKLPENGNPYVTGNQEYGEREFASGYFVVYSGANAQAVIRTLDPAKTYYFYIFEYNNITTLNGNPTSVQTAENYLTPTVPEAVPAYVAPGTPLPVELKSFAAKLTAGGVKLDWATASEKNNKGFEVQRSQDGEQFAALQFVKGHGSKASATVYSALDVQPLSGTSYYRLKQVDEDGTFAYSPVAAITNTEAAREATFYPNPAHDVLNISANEPLVGARVTVADLTGRIVLTSTLDATNRVSLSTLRTGTYLVTVETNTGKIIRKIVKE